MRAPYFALRERRREPRQFFAGPIRFEWQTVGGDILCARGITRDVSARGVYSFIEHALTVGMQVRFDVLRPSEKAGEPPAVYRCGGRVLRSERRGSRFGIAASIQLHHFIDSSSPHRRTHQRIVPATPVIARYGRLSAVVRDISHIGAFIEDHHPLPVGSRVELHLQGKGAEASVVQAVVRRVEESVGMGLEFVALSSKADEDLRLLISGES